MKKSLALLLVLTFTFLCLSILNAQKSYKDKYKEFIKEGEKLLFSNYQKIGIKSNDYEFIMLTFFPETKHLTSEIKYKDKNFEVKNGYATYWYDNSKMWKEGNFKNDLKEGHRKEYEYGNGKIKNEGSYKLNKKSGIWKTYYKNNSLSDVFTYIDGKLEGTFTNYDTLGILNNEGIYSNDSLISETNPDTIVKIQPYFGDCGEEENMIKSQKKLMTYLGSNMIYPNDARDLNIEGQAIIRFIIDKEGKISDVVALVGVSKSIKESALKLLETMPNWCPGTSNGKNVNVTFTLPLTYKLE